MNTDLKVRQGTFEWFEMAGRLMSNAASKAKLSRDLSLSLVERYSDGLELSEGLVQGIRFDLIRGEPLFRVGAERGERADIVVEITAAAARELNLLHSEDPRFREARDRFLSIGEMQVEGDLSRLGKWLEDVHDPIVDRTA